MKIECFPIKMKEEEALRIARGGKNPIMRAMFGKKKIKMHAFPIDQDSMYFHKLSLLAFPVVFPDLIVYLFI